MIELTEEQRKSVRDGRAVRVRENGQEYVLLRTDVYDRLAEAAYDDSSANCHSVSVKTLGGRWVAQQRPHAGAPRSGALDEETERFNARVWGRFQTPP